MFHSHCTQKCINHHTLPAPYQTSGVVNFHNTSWLICLPLGTWPQCCITAMWEPQSPINWELSGALGRDSRVTAVNGRRPYKLFEVVLMLGASHLVWERYGEHFKHWSQGSSIVVSCDTSVQSIMYKIWVLLCFVILWYESILHILLSVIPHKMLKICQTIAVCYPMLFILSNSKKTYLISDCAMNR